MDSTKHGGAAAANSYRSVDGLGNYSRKHRKKKIVVDKRRGYLKFAPTTPLNRRSSNREAVNGESIMMMDRKFAER